MTACGYSSNSPPTQPTERRSLLYAHPPLDFGFLRRMQLDAEVQRSAELDVLANWTLHIVQAQRITLTKSEIHFMLSEGIVATSRPFAEYDAAYGCAMAMVCADEMAQKGAVDAESVARLCRLAMRTGDDQARLQVGDLRWWAKAANAWIQKGLDFESAITSQSELCLSLCAALPGVWPAAHIASQIPRMAAGQPAATLAFDVYWDHQYALRTCLPSSDAWRRLDGSFHPADYAVRTYGDFLRGGQTGLDAFVECWAKLQEKRCADARKARESGMADAFLPAPNWPDAG